jgi:hypothetical protein
VPACLPADGDVGAYRFDAGSARDLRQDATWLRDSAGRYAMLRGVNLASRSKMPPYLPVLPLDSTRLDSAAVGRELDRLRPELCRLERIGVNVVRLLVAWKAIEPEHHDPPGALSGQGRAYLEAVEQVVDALYQGHGMFVILDFHQDIASEAYGGDGFPDWALAIDAAHPRPRAVPSPSEWWGMRYYDVPGRPLNKAVRHTLQSFWRNRLTNAQAGVVDDEVQTHLVRTIGLTAEFFRGHPAILGYEPFNEPHQVGIPKEVFERDMLAAFYQAVLTEVARRDPKAFVLVEPRMDWTTYPADASEPSLLRPWSIFSFTDRPRTFLRLPTLPGPDGRSHVIFSFHFYDPGLVGDVPLHRSLSDKARTWPRVFAALDDAVRAQGVVPFLTEFGCNQDWTGRPDVRGSSYATVARACMDLQYREVEARLWNAAYWVCDFYSRRRDGKVSENWNEENMSLLGPDGPQNADVAARPYPMRSSAKPERVAFDLASKRAVVILSGPVAVAPTVVFVPEAVHYAETGFAVRATTSRPVLWDERRQTLYWWPRPDDRRHGLVILGGGATDDRALPQGTGDLRWDSAVWRFGRATREGRKRLPEASPAGVENEGSAARGRAGRPGRGRPG